MTSPTTPRQAEFDYYRNRATAQLDVRVWPAVGQPRVLQRRSDATPPRIDNYRSNVGPEWYSFNYGNRHFVVLENNGAAPFDEQFDWLEGRPGRATSVRTPTT